VLLLAGGHVRGAHDAAPCLAARADPLAAVGRRAHAAGERQPRRQWHRGGQLGVAQVLGHGRRVDHHAGVQAAVRVEERLHLAKRLVEVVAEDPAVERAAHEPVAVLGRVDPVELADEIDDLLRDGLERLDPLPRGQVDERPDVQAADRAVPVEAGLETVPVEHLAEARDVVVETLGRDGGVLHERRRAACPRARRHQQAEGRLAHLSQRVLLGGRLGPQGVVAVTVLAPGGLEGLEPVVGLRFVAGEEGHIQQRGGVALEHLGEPPKLELAPRQVEDRLVEQLDRSRAERQSILGRGDGAGHRLEVPDGEHLHLRQRHQPDGGLGDRDQCALRARDEASKIERAAAGQAVEAVAARLAPVLRVAVRDRIVVLAHDLRQPAIERALERGGGGPAGARRPREPPRARGRARSSTRRRSSGFPTSCCRSCRRSWPG
jgi:hypothetical protein